MREEGGKEGRERVWAAVQQPRAAHGVYGGERPLRDGVEEARGTRVAWRVSAQGKTREGKGGPGRTDRTHRSDRFRSPPREGLGPQRCSAACWHQLIQLVKRFC